MKAFSEPVGGPATQNHPNHEEALELARLRRDESNLARCYLDLLEEMSARKDWLPAEEIAEREPLIRHAFAVVEAQSFNTTNRRLRNELGVLVMKMRNAWPNLKSGE